MGALGVLALAFDRLGARLPAGPGVAPPRGAPDPFPVGAGPRAPGPWHRRGATPRDVVWAANLLISPRTVGRRAHDGFAARYPPHHYVQKRADHKTETHGNDDDAAPRDLCHKDRPYV